MMPDQTAAPPQLPPAQPALTAGRYLKLRREAAGLTVLRVATAIAPPAPMMMSRRIEQAESDELVLTSGEIASMRTVFAFDMEIYANLRDDLPAGRICTGCGCSWNDPCPGGCAWASSIVDLCTACSMLSPAELHPVHAAFDDVSLFGARDVGALLAALDGIDRDAVILSDHGRAIIGIVSRMRAGPDGDRKEIVLVFDRPAPESVQ